MVQSGTNTTNDTLAARFQYPGFKIAKPVEPAKSKGKPQGTRKPVKAGRKKKRGSG